jgi:hypothetical protein
MRPRRVPLALALALSGVALLAAGVARAQQRPVPGTAQDQQDRRHAAAVLRQQGFDVDWRLASSPELHDWTLRADEARVLRDRYGVIIDWRSYSMAEMKDWEGRIARATDLRRLGIEADWRLYTARQLDELRIYLERARAQPPSSPRPAQELVPAEVTLGFDPDAILVPTYVTEELSRDAGDDAILEPNFSRSRRRGAAAHDGLPAARPAALPAGRAPTPAPAAPLPLPAAPAATPPAPAR